MITLDVQGLDQIEAELRRRQQAAEVGGRRLISDYGAYTHDLTHQLSPYDVLELYDTFHMRENIRIETDDDGLGMEVGWREEDFTVEGFFPYYLVWEFGSTQHAAQPSLGPAWNELEPSFEEDAEQLVQATMIEGR